MKVRMFQFAAPLVGLMLLGGVGLDKWCFHTPPASAAPYHAKVRAVAAEFPKAIGEWRGDDEPLTAGAIAILHPNSSVSRRYRPVSYPRLEVRFLMVQCENAGDMEGHFPPRCYPSQGAVLSVQKDRDWQVDDLLITGREYEFVYTRIQNPGSTIVYNFMILPDGSLCRDMVGVEAVAQSARKKFYGAAQIQLVCKGDMPVAMREAAFMDMVRAARPLIDTIRSGVPR